MAEAVKVKIGDKIWQAELGTIWRFTVTSTGKTSVLEFTPEVMRNPDPYILEWVAEWADITSVEGSTQGSQTN